MRVPPYSDGWHFAKRRGFSGKHAGIDIQEQLTDEEFDDDHYDAVPAPHSSAKTGQKLASSSSK
jgi:palmitoyltransferase